MNSVGVIGIGAVTPRGAGSEAIRMAVLGAGMPTPDFLPGPPGARPLPVLRVAPACEVRHPRLRRASPISHFAAAAALAATAAIPGSRMALIFAASDGAVIYSRRFFEEVITSGSGSPLLFPETVYNAAASHVAAMLGIDGCVLTMVGDATAGTSALSTALDVLAANEADQCLVVAAQEVDWISVEGYRRWGLAAGGRRPGTTLAEGACALLLGPAAPGDVVLNCVHPGLTATPHARKETLRRLCQDLSRDELPDLAILSAAAPSGDAAEDAAVLATFPSARRIRPKSSLGEAFATSTLLQVACGCLSIREGLGRRAAITVPGLTGQTGGVLLTASAAGG